VKSDFLSDLWADLRDRGLLPIIGLLLVCLVAIPFLLGGGGEEPAAGPPAGTATASAEPLPGIETRPVVVASPAELRSYKKRLSTFSSRNPFRPDIVTPAGNGDGGADGTTDPAASTTDPLSTPNFETPSDLPAVDTPAPSTPTTPTTPTSPDDTGTSGDTGSSDQLISIRIDVEAGKAGNAKPIDDVKALDFLPDPQHPVVQYIGGTFDLKKAAFVVSPGIESTDGDGKCAPSPDNCQFLMMEVGEQQNFVYRAEKYVLKLVEVKEHSTPVDSSSDSAGKDPSGARGAVRNSMSAVRGG
jgi:hypothetical protein